MGNIRTRNDMKIDAAAAVDNNFCFPWECCDLDSFALESTSSGPDPVECLQTGNGAGTSCLRAFHGDLGSLEGFQRVVQ